MSLEHLTPAELALVVCGFAAVVGVTLGSLLAELDNWREPKVEGPRDPATYSTR